MSYDGLIVNYEKIAEIYSRCGILSFPINCISVLNHYRFRVFTYSYLKENNTRLYELGCEFSNDAFKYRDIIAYNEKKPEARIRFSLMHELGHYILGHVKEIPECEDEADRFASHFLAPRIAIHKKGCRTADQIHDVFGLSYCAANRALADYKNWYHYISRTTKKPSLPEQQIEQLIFSPKKTITHKSKSRPGLFYIDIYPETFSAWYSSSNSWL